MTPTSNSLLRFALALIVAMCMASRAANVPPAVTDIDCGLFQKICQHKTPTEPARATDSCETVQSLDRRDEKTWPVLAVHAAIGLTIPQLPYHIARENIAFVAVPQRYPLIESHRGPPAHRA